MFACGGLRLPYSLLVISSPLLCYRHNHVSLTRNHCFIQALREKGAERRTASSEGLAPDRRRVLYSSDSSGERTTLSATMTPLLWISFSRHVSVGQLCRCLSKLMYRARFHQRQHSIFQEYSRLFPVAFPQRIGTSPFLPPLPLGHIYAAEDTPSPAAPSIEYSMAPTTPSAEDSPAPTTSSAGDTTAPVASPAATPAPATLTVRKNGLYSVSYFYVTFFWAHEAFR